jgi:hypothetical protein
MLTTAGGRITCPQCTARSKRTQQRCIQPAMRGRSVCRAHGGKSTGARTSEGKARIAAAHTTHGRETRQIRQERSEQLTYLAELEDLARELGMISGPKTRGRKPKSCEWTPH